MILSQITRSVVATPPSTSGRWSNDPRILIKAAEAGDSSTAMTLDLIRCVGTN
ncbi:uncharacterized protein BDR25DRAFT_352959 [Lindgomyces ingoldianus]|uniref:Uncharacterized protein n=1 Tax=Lindgomyces ingoldianus TaxID=673940 RepID=A0ACB6R048_9PLEO|nr:uncharacterized protein BDR25DRAFT_352959 [Lindgomyces ingoldianus]KAF2472653.1 hypothetical protein BDR25DRAFT_352959 [Lindgomyces ingoldianus]